MTNKTSSETAREEELSKIISPKKDRVALDGSLYSFQSVRPFVHSEWYQNRYDLSHKEINQWRTAWREYLQERFPEYFENLEVYTPEEYKTSMRNEPFHLQHIRMSTSDKEIYPLEVRQKSEPIAHISIGEDELLRAIRRGDNQGIEDAFNERFSF